MEKKKLKATHTQSGCVIVDGAVSYENLSAEQAKQFAEAINKLQTTDYDIITRHLSNPAPNR